MDIVIYRQAACAIALLTLWDSPIHAQESDANRSFRFYGHISPTLLSVDDGVSHYSNLVDNANSGGRVGFWYQKGQGDNTFKINGEISLGMRTSASLSQLYTPPLFEAKSQSIRKFEAILDTQRYGTFSIGQGSMGSDGVTESDLSGTTLASYVGISEVAGSYVFRTAAGGFSTVRIQGAFPTFDGGRSQRVRYDSPEINFSRLGYLKFAASIGAESTDRNVTVNDALSDAGLYYRNQLSNFAMAGSVRVSIADVSGDEAPQIAGSFSVLHEPSGINLTLASGSRDQGGTYTFIKAGLRGNWFSAGDTAVSLDWYQSINTVNAGSDAQSFGIGVLQHLSRQNVDVFLGIRAYKYDGGGVVQFQKMTSAIIGVRWVFRRLEKRTIFEDLWQK
jgi:hypothetical protein